VGERVDVRGSHVATVTGRANRALIRGVVVRRSGVLTLLRTGGWLLVVHSRRAIASASGGGPAPGTIVEQSVSFDDQGNLDDQGEQDVGQSTSQDDQGEDTDPGDQADQADQSDQASQDDQGEDTDPGDQGDSSTTTTTTTTGDNGGD
jgi:hypothetical protein